MALTIDDVQHVARLARIALTDEEVEALVPQLSKILSYAEQIGQVATEDVPPTAHAYHLVNVLRDDEPRPSLSPGAVTASAPDAEDGRFRVPRIVGDEA